MLFTGLALAAATASKWLIAGKIMATVGTGMMTIAPAVEKLTEKE